MKVEFYDDIEMFCELTIPFLLKNEAENNLLLAILNYLKDDLYTYGDFPPILISISDNKEIKLISLRTPPFGLVLSYTNDDKTIPALVKELLKRNLDLPSILGPKKTVKKFVAPWCQKRNLKSRLIRNERIYKLEEVSENTLGDRTFIKGTKSHQELILKWGRQFTLEALPETKENEIDRTLKQLIRNIELGRIFLLLDKNEPVSMAGVTGKTPNGIRIGPVYTPSFLRRNGYATNCFARLSKHLLKEGNKFCFLFTDLSNPISNSIYQKIGYRGQYLMWTCMNFCLYNISI